MSESSNEQLRCYRCKLYKDAEAFSPSRRVGNNRECRACRRACRQADRVKRIELFSGNYEEIVQVCYCCGFTELSRHFVEDKASPSGHRNTCLACHRDKSREHKSKNRGLIRQQNRKYKQRNRELLRQQRREYKQRNREKVNAYERHYNKSNPHIRILYATRKAIARALKCNSTGGRSLKLLGVSSAVEYKAYLESKFELGMSWANYGNGLDKWTIDHIKPLFTFDLTDPKQQRKAFHYTNTRPMWQSENSSNGSIARWRKKGVVDLISAL